jgi:hypothetical protein
MFVQVEELDEEDGHRIVALFYCCVQYGDKMRQKDEVVSVHTIKTYIGSRGMHQSF